MIESPDTPTAAKEPLAAAPKGGLGRSASEANDVENPLPEPTHGRNARTCIGCSERAEPHELVRLVLGPDGEVAVDAAGGGFGRGAHVHARTACLTQAASRGLLRATKGQAERVALMFREEGAIVTSEGAALSAQALGLAIEEAMARRIAGLLGTAVRTRTIRVGSDAASGAWFSGDAALMVVAIDAAAARDLGAVREAVSKGSAVAWGTKQTLAGALARSKSTAEGVGVLALTDTRIAEAVRDAVEKSLGAHGAAVAAKRPNAASGALANHKANKEQRMQSRGELSTTGRGVTARATQTTNQSNVESRRVGRASGRRARVKQAVAERSE